MPNYNRIASIDIMRGLTILLMLFVNDLYMKTVPAWLGHMPADFDGMGLADWVFPGFLFIVGMAIPFSLSKRLSTGNQTREISKHILFRTASLLIIGVLMLNSARVDPEITGIGKNLWALLMYIGVFLVWNDYHDKENRFFTIAGLRLAGIAILVFLVMKFQSGKPDNNGSLITGWWGILGLIGWGYLVAGFAYLLCRDSIWKTSLLTLFFLVLNILTQLNMIRVSDLLQTIFGVIIDGNVPFIVMAGLVAGLIIKNFSVSGSKRIIIIFIISALTCLAAGLFLRNWFIISKIKATPSWGLICTGISTLLFILIYWITDVIKKTRWASFLRPAGEHSLTAYLAPDIFYYLIWMSGMPLLIYKQSPEPLIVVAGSILWALIMIGVTAILIRLNIRLKI